MSEVKHYFQSLTDVAETQRGKENEGLLDKLSKRFEEDIQLMHEIYLLAPILSMGKEWRERSTSQTKGTLVVIDDQKQMLRSFVDSLKFQGYEIFPYVEPEKALRDLSSLGKIDALITDLNLPNINGIQVAKEAKKILGNTVPVIIITGNRIELEYEMVGKKEGFVFRSKPIKPTDIEGIIE